MKLDDGFHPQAWKHIATLRMARPDIVIEIRWCLAYKGVTSGEKKLRPERPDALDALDVSDATCLTRTTLAMAPCVPTHRATAYASRRVVSGRFPSGRSACLTDVGSQGKCRPDDKCHGICLLDEECQGIPYGRRVSGHLPSGRSAFLTDGDCQGKFLPDVECQGKCRPDDACHGICLLDAECQDICHPDAAVSYRRSVARQIGYRRCLQWRTTPR